MAISLRLEQELERQLEVCARTKGVTKSTLIRSLIQGFVRKHYQRPTAWELGKDLFGRHSSGKGDLSINRKRYLKEILD
jgi:hypothetical protein